MRLDAGEFGGAARAERLARARQADCRQHELGPAFALFAYAALTISVGSVIGFACGYWPACSKAGVPGDGLPRRPRRAATD